MENFYNGYLFLLKNPKQRNPENLKNFHDFGIKLVLEPDFKFENKELILYCMMNIFHENYILEYYMGVLFKNINQSVKAIRWFHLCYEKNRNYVENLLDYCQILIENHLYDLVDSLNVDNYFATIKDYRFQGLYAIILFQKKQIKSAIKIYLEIFEKAQTEINDEHYITSVSNLAFAYNSLRDFDNSFKYSKIALDLIEKSDVDNKNIKKILISNIILARDFIFLDKSKERIYKLALKNVEKVYPISELYDISKLKKNSKKIKIGYVSHDFKNHAVTNFIFPILENHNFKKFEIYVYNNHPTERFQNNNWKIFSVFDLSTKELGDLIFSHNIDILIDLNGHTSGNRLDVFAKKPAKIQMTYCGFPNTTNLSTIDYRITDLICDPKDNTNQKFSEKLLYMNTNQCFLLFDAIVHPPNKNVVELSKKDEIFLGSLNKESKLSNETLALWNKILEKVKNSRLLIKINEDNQEQKQFYIEKLGLLSDRVLFTTHCSDDNYNKLFQTIDIMLDPFPYSGTTTTAYALYNSIPVVTLYNSNGSHAQNVSSSLLYHSGLKELIAHNEEEYIQIVVDLCEHPNKIKKYKKHIHDKFMNECMDKKKFMENYENLLLSTIN